MIDAFRQADRRLGGRHLYQAVVGHLTYSLAPRLISDPTGAQATITFGTAYTLSEMAGFMAADCGDDTAALAHFRSAVPLARATGEPDLEPQIHASIALLLIQTGEARAGLQEAEAGYTLARARGTHPQIQARLAAMRARAHAVIGEHYAAETWLEQAQSALALPARAALAPWVSGFDPAALASESAQTYLDLDHRSAIRHASAAVNLRTSDRARSLALSRALLAEAYLRQGELNAACELGGQLLAESHGVGSARLVTALASLRGKLAAQRTYPQAASLLEDLDHALRRGQGLLHRTALGQESP